MLFAKLERDARGYAILVLCDNLGGDVFKEMSD
jgi:hypothetical protein